MAWKSGSAAALRNRNEKERQEKTVMATAVGGAEPLSQRKSADSRNPLALGSTGTSWAKGSAAALRAQKQQEATSRQTGTDLYSMALEDYRTRNNLGFADAMDSRSNELNRQKVTVSPAEKMEQNASTVQKLREQRNNGIRMDVYSTVNNWKDASERNRELARLVTEPTLPRGAVSAADLPAGVDYLAADTGGMGIMPVLENTRYMDSDLKKMGYTQDEINRARLYMKAYNDLSLGERAGRRVESDLEGNKENIKGMIGQYAGALSPALTASAEEQMIRRVQSGRYTNEQLEAAGYDPELIRTAHERIRSGELYDKADDDSNRLKGLYEWGRDAHKAGENLTADAMAGESNVGRFFHGATSSAAENLIVSAINPALVLPVLSAHGAGDSMAASDEAGESPEKAILKATAKFGAGWAINSVGVADLAKTMGSDYAKDTVAGTIADWVRRQVGNQAFREAYPAIANAISGGADNAMQAFVETYADKAIDAVMGDQEAAKTLFNKDTFLTALEAGLSGGASGALGGAVGTGLSRMNAGDSSLRGNVERYAAQDEYEQALKEHQRREELAREPGETAGPTAETAANRQAMVENAGESVESSTETAADGAEPLSQRISADSPPSMGAIGRTGNVELTAQNGADRQAVMQSVPVEESTLEGMDSGSSPMRETYGMEAPRTEGQKQARTEQVLRSWKVDEKAAQEISLKQPEGVDSDRYAAAASTLYRLGQMEDVKTFDQALELAGTGSGMAANVNYVLGNLKGRNALEIAYTYGRDAAETRWAKSQLGGTLTEQSLTGRGETIYKGTLRNANDAGSQVIELNAAATGTTAVLKNVLQNGAGQADSRVRAYVDTETARIFFGDSTQDTFGTVLHEDYHWYNALDSEGAKTLQDHALLYLARSSGFETVDEMIREKMTDYAQQNLTYEEAAEELVGDAWRGIFSNESDFKRWVEFQRGQAEKNSGRAGTIRTVMNRVKEMLGGIISRAKEVLTLDPDNRAALKAQRLAENERRILQDEYFAHAQQAMDNLRSAKENAAALKTESAAEGRNIRFSIQKDADGESYIKIDEDILNGVPREEWKTVVKQAIKERYPNGFERNGWTILNSKEGRKEFVWSRYTKGLQWENGTAYADKLRMAANLDEIIRTADEVYREPAFHKNAEAFNRGKIKVMVGPNAYEADVLTAIKADDREIFYDIVDVQPTKIEPSGKAHMESEDSGSRGSEGSIYQESADTVLKTEEGGERPSFPAKNSIAQENAESKGNSEPVKKSVRFQLSAPVEVDQNKDLVAVHNLTAENLQEALELGGMPSPSIAVVKAQEGHTKYGPISLVFNSDTIDPMVNRANRIYGSDAWTPTRPNVEFEVNYNAMRDFESKVDSASKDAFEGKFANSAALQRLGIEETSSSDRAELAQRLEENTAVQLAYLEAKGKTVEPVYKTERDQFDSLGNDTLEKVIEHIGADEIKAAFEGGDFDQLDQLVDKAADALEEKYTHGQLEGQNRRWQMRIDKIRNDNRGRLYGMLEHAYKMLTDTNAGKQAMDVEATREAIRQEAPAEDVKNWVYDQLGNVLGQKGIRNGKDRFTPAGIKRSFAQLHNSYTLENLVAAMNAQNARGQDTWGLSASTLMSTTTAEYQNLDEVRADKGRLQQMPEEEYKALLEKADDQISDILDKLRRETTPQADNSFEEREILGGILMQAAQGKQTAAAIGKAFAKEGYTIGKDTAQMILNLYKNVAAIPTGYFEAKPQRAVGFDEVRAAILPDNTSSTLIDSLKETGIDVKLYKAGDDAQRTALLNKVPNVRFQLAEQAERDARKNTQRQASRAIADNSAAMETLAQMMGVTHGVRISQDSIDGLAVRWTKANGSRADRTKIAGETRALVEYMTADGASMSKASALSETIADEILSGATYRNTELWDEYPEYHDLSYTVNKDGPAKAELVKRYGTWSEAVAEARRHGVKLRQAEGVRDGNPAEVYEAIVNDTRAMGGTKEGAAALFRGAAQAAGVDGAASMESTEWLDVLMNVHDAIKPRMMSRFADAAEYEDAKVELADRMLGDILNVPEMTDAQAIFDGFQRWQRQAVAAAVGEENAEQALKDLRKVQKEQNREFNRRMYENSRNQTVNRYAEENPGAGQRELKNVGDMNEFLTFNREEYERRLRAERQRLKMERQQMLDEITLEFAKRENELNIENDLLAHEYAKERARADYAERQLMVQDQEIADWEEENRRKAAQWEKLQKERDRKAEELWNDFADKVQEGAMSEIAKAAKANELAERRAKLARESRKKDELKRAIRNNATQLNQMALRPAKDKYVQPRLILRALEVAKLADMTLLNQNAVNRLDALANSIRAEYGDANHPVVTEMSNDWEQSGIANLIDALKADLSASKEAQLDQLRGQLAEAEALEDSQKVRKLRSRLEARIKDVENKPYLPMTANQLRVLKAITTSTLHVIRQANKTLSLQQAEAVDKIAGEAAVEVNRSKGNDGKFRRMLTRYNLDMLGGTRVFRMLGGYAKNSQMEKLGTMLNDGQRRQTEILVEGTHLFDNVTGKKNLKQMEQFAGKGAKLVDLGLKDNRGKAVPLTHAQMCSLYMHLRNADSKEHLMNGGFTVPDAVEYNKGNIVEAYQKGQTVRIGMLTDSEGKPMADTIVSAIEKNLTDYDRAWIGSMENFFGSYTTDLINETSMKLLGYKRAVVKNYYPIAVNKKALATQIEGLHLDATIEGRGFLKNRVKSPQPILLEECNNVVQRSLRDTAAYAGLAPAIRDVQKVLNSRIETEDGLKVLKNGILEEKWGSDAVNYVDELLTDLQTPGRKTRKSSMTALGKLRGNYAGAILTLNPGVAIAQAASLPTAGAVLGADTMAAVVPFVKNFSHKQRAALEAEIAEHGDALLQYRLRGTQRGELESIGKNLSAAEKGMEKVPKQLTGWINGVDEITVAALWEGSKRYVEHHTNEFAEGAATKGSEAYWEAVNKTYQRVIEETQPNYTTMQRAGIQRSDNELVRTLTMFTTQRFQNYGILADAVMAYNAQRERSHADPTEENRAELKRAGKNLNRAVTSQIVQTAVFAAMKIGADFLLHRWDREQDENGDVTAASMKKRFADLFLESAAGNFLYGSELYSLANNVIQGKDYDVVSASNLSIVNDVSADFVKIVADVMKLLNRDTADMSEAELEKFHQNLIKHVWAFVDDGFDALGVPMGNADKFRKAVAGYLSDIEKAAKGEEFSFNSTPSSATGQYDRLYNAIAEGDRDNAAGAMEKLEAMGKDEKTITSQLKTRLKKYNRDVLDAAKARNEGDDRKRRKLTEQIVRDMYDTLGIREGVKADAEKRAWVIDLVTGAIDSKADELLAGGTEGSVYDALTEAVDNGRASDVQDEIRRLRTAGKADSQIKSKITDAVKEAYLAGNDQDREQLEQMLLKLEKADGSQMYEEKNFAQWVKDAAKKEEQAKNSKDEWAGVR